MLDVEQRSGVTILRLHKGKVNALDLELVRAITEAFGDLPGDAAVVLTGAGGAFSAGVDLRRIADGGPAYAQQFLPALSASFMAVFDHPGPVVAAVNGHAIAGGCVIAAACDVRLMSRGTIGLAELSVGVPFPVSAIEIVRYAAGPAAGWLALTAQLLGPAQAQAIGLIHEVHEVHEAHEAHEVAGAGPGTDALLDAAVARARQMAATPADVFSLSKRALQRPARDRIAERSAEDEAVLALWSSARTREAIAGYLDTLRQRPRQAR